MKTMKVALLVRATFIVFIYQYFINLFPNILTSSRVM